VLAQAALVDLTAVNVYGPTANATLAGNAIGISGTGTPIDHMPPFLTINYSIAVQGIFPSRN
jgi:microcystin-dependent protein